MPEFSKVKVVKRAECTGELLSGAKFGIYNAVDDRLAAELTTNGSGTAISGSLPVGSYYLMELRAPIGYIADSKKIYFNLDMRETKEITVTNMPEQLEKNSNSYVKLIKLAEGTSTPLSGAVFGIYRRGSDEKVAELVTGIDGIAKSTALHAGEYYLQEIKAPVGYKLNTEKQGFYLNAGEMKEITVLNSPNVPDTLSTGNLHLTKKAEYTSECLSGAIYGVYNAATNAKISEIITGADGTAAYDLPEGSYFLWELKAPVGFTLEASRIPFDIVAGAVTKVVATDKAEKGSVRLIVKDVSGPALEGAVFNIYYANGEQLAEIVTGVDGKALYELPAGEYYMLEIKPPEGYFIGKEEYGFYVTSGQTVDVLVLKQRTAAAPQINIPKTGEPFPWLNYALAALFIGIAIFCGIGISRTRKRG